MSPEIHLCPYIVMQQDHLSLYHLTWKLVKVKMLLLQYPL